MLYNPFEQVTKSSFRERVELSDVVFLRFEWPDGRKKKEAFYSRLDDKEAAGYHAHQLGTKEEDSLAVAAGCR